MRALSKSQVAEIKRLHEAGQPYRALAQRFNVSRQTIARAVGGSRKPGRQGGLSGGKPALEQSRKRFAKKREYWAQRWAAEIGHDIAYRAYRQMEAQRVEG